MSDTFPHASYHVTTGKLTAEQYDVPQTCKRVFLIARHDREVSLPGAGDD